MLAARLDLGANGIRDLRGATAEAIDKPIPKAKATLAALMTVRICIVDLAELLDGQILWPGLNKPTVLGQTYTSS